MKILSVLIQHAKISLDRSFSYAYKGNKEVGVGFRVLVSFHSQKLMGFVSDVTETEKTLEQYKDELGYSLDEIIDVIDEKPLLNDELLRLADEVSAYYLCPRISVLQTMLPKTLKPAMSSLHGPKIAYENYVEFVNGDEEGLTDKQIEMLRLLGRNLIIKKSEIGSPSVLNKLIEAKKAKIVKREKQRFEIKDYEKEQPHVLNEDQKAAYQEIINSKKNVILLQGVTGSGKTEVYLHLSEYYLKQGKNILMLVPEIALTPIMVEYFSRRFKGDVAILHSELTPAQKYDEYRRIAEGKARVVVGARSAVFAPLENIGLIILDEEHVESYKQDTVPFYHAREVAKFRASHFNAKIVLGSATPSLETKARALKGTYGYALLRKRVNEKELPKTSIVNLTEKGIIQYGSSIFSKPLVSAIKETIARNEQVMLLINRRGYSSYCTCSDCGHIFVCPSCGSNLSYHKEDDMLKCHHCDFVMKNPQKCPSCGGTHLQRIGFGTQRIVKILNELIPSARVGRLDSDIGKVRNNIAKELGLFRNHVYDILVGTQMIAKGHDFPNVTLVGVVLADIGLALPNYRASERTFQLIAQAVGRSGRASKEGRAIIQTYNPKHYAITLASTQDYEAFYSKEIQQRQIGKYSPFYHLMVLSFGGKKEDKVIEACASFKEHLENKNFDETMVIGPLTPFYAFIGETYKRNLLVKYRDAKKVKQYIGDLLKSVSGKGGIDIVADVDPLDY